MKTYEVAFIISRLRRKWTPLAEHRLQGDAEDILTLAAEFTLKRSIRLTNEAHVSNCYVKSLYNYIKSAIRARHIRRNYTNSQIILNNGSIEWGYSDRYELRQALNIALGSLPDDTRMDIWRRYVVGDSFRAIAKSRGLYARAISNRVKLALERLREHPALGPWKPKSRLSSLNG